MTFVTVLRSGGVFDAQWVERLNRDARQHLNPDRVVCLADRPLLDCETIPLVHDWPGWFSKLELFRPGLFTGPVFYCDLDTAIVRPIPSLWSQIAYHGHLMLLNDFFTPARPASGCMGWIPSEQTERIYHEFAARPQLRSGWQYGDGAHIGKFPHVRLQSVFPGAFGSLKADKLDAGPKWFSIVCQHGKPKFCDLPPAHWMHRAWLGERICT